MALSIKDEQTDKLIRQLAEITGESYTRAIMQAVKERLARLSAPAKTEKAEMARKLEEFMANRPRRKFRGGKSLKQIRDELWGL